MKKRTVTRILALILAVSLACSLCPAAFAEENVQADGTALPYGFAGLAEGDRLTDGELAAKQALRENGAAEQAAELTAGRDYAEGQVTAFACTQEQAGRIAAAYSGTLVSWSDCVAVIGLPAGVTVPEAVEAAEDPALPLPAVSPNYAVHLDPETELSALRVPDASISSIPTLQSWQTWVQENLSDPDPFLQDPSSFDYEWMHDMVDTYEAWGVTTGSDSVTVAVVDTGVMANHEELTGRVSSIDIGLGYDNMDGHATHVAGIIAAALNNGKGGAGIAPGVRILSVRVLDSTGSGSNADIARGIAAAARNGADIINMSLGGYWYDETMNQAVQYAVGRGVTVIAAMGNDGGNVLCYPAAYDNVIAVAAVDSTGARADYSNYGDWADIAAPGSGIWSAYNNSTSSYESLNGTSMATPVVAGAAALYMSAAGHVSPAVMEKVLKASVSKSLSSQIGAGIVDAAKMFSADKTKPVITVKDANGNEITSFKNAVPYGSTVSLASATGINGATIVYTLDGRTPAVKNGEIVTGQEYTGPIALDSFSVGKSVTVRAACVSGMGVLGTAASVTFRMSAYQRADGIRVTVPKTVAAGKSVTLTAAVEPATAAQKVNWAIGYRDDDLAGASISTSGVLRTAAGHSGTLQLICASAADPDIYEDGLYIQVKDTQPVAAMTLSPAKITLTYANGAGAAQQLTPMMTDTKKNVISAADVTLQWSSSNTKVAAVDTDGLVTAVGKGSAAITCKAMDGSGKSAKCTVTVQQLVESVAVTGQLSIAPGASASYRAAVLPATASTRTCSWSLTGAPEGVTISSSGAVRAASTVAAGSSFTVTATAKDGSGAAGSMEVTIQQKASYLMLDVGEADYDHDRTYSRSGLLTNLQLYTVNVPNTYETSDRDESSAALQVTSDCAVGTFQWMSSNAKVASVDENGVVTAAAAGTAQITCTALDGSGKRASVAVKVIVPCSTISVQPVNAGQYAIAYGTSMSFRAVLGDAYGKPTVTKVRWELHIGEYDENGSYIREYLEDGAENPNWTDWTGLFGARKIVTLSSSGVLKVTGAWPTLAQTVYDNGHTLQINVEAWSTDNTWLGSSCYVYPTPPAAVLRTDSTTYYADTESSLNVEIFSDCLYGYTVTSSNPRVASAVYAGGVNDDNGNYLGDYAELVTHAAGTAKITIKANDGSGKTWSFTVKVVG